MPDAKVRNHLKYICSAYFAEGDSDGRFNCTEKAMIDLKLYKSVKSIFSSASVVNHPYSIVETNTLPFLYSFLYLPRAGLTLRKIPRSTLWLPLQSSLTTNLKEQLPWGTSLRNTVFLGFFFFTEIKRSLKITIDHNSR